MRPLWPGTPFPLGATFDGEGTNFALFSENADRVQLCLFDDAGKEERIDLLERTSGAGGHAPDPQAVETFERSKLTRREPDRLFAELLALRRELPREVDVEVDGRRVRVRRGGVELVADLDARSAEVRR